MKHGCLRSTVSTLIPHSESFTSPKSVGGWRSWGRAYVYERLTHKEKSPQNSQMEKKKKKRICWGHGLFSPEAVIYLGQDPALNHCVCFYGLSGFVWAPQPLKAVWGTADFSPNLGIVKPHHFLALEKCLASHFCCWGRVYISSDGACRWA